MTLACFRSGPLVLLDILSHKCEIQRGKVVKPQPLVFDPNINGKKGSGGIKVKCIPSTFEGASCHTRLTALVDGSRIVEDSAHC